LQAQVLVPGPVEVQVAFTSQPPLEERQLLMGAQEWPSPAYPAMHAQVAVPGPELAHVAWESQPPLPVAQAFTGVQTVPLPE
jgi:hypothetical protein